jgi:hypothetical protein
MPEEADVGGVSRDAAFALHHLRRALPDGFAELDGSVVPAQPSAQRVGGIQVGFARRPNLVPGDLQPKALALQDR